VLGHDFPLLFCQGFLQSGLSDVLKPRPAVLIH